MIKEGYDRTMDKASQGLKLSGLDGPVELVDKSESLEAVVAILHEAELLPVPVVQGELAATGGTGSGEAA